MNKPAVKKNTDAFLNKFTKGVFRLLAQYQKFTRNKRMKRFIETMSIKGGERIIDLGGTPEFWDGFPYDVQVLVVNLPSKSLKTGPCPKNPNILVAAGDACSLPEHSDMAFDIVFSNSVIEHVGDAGRRKQFAGEAKRLGPRYWIQTPSIWFPIEAHTYMLFWWFYPKPLREWIKSRWRKRLPAWVDMIDGTTVIRRGELENLFNDGRIITEKQFGVTKSYICIREGLSAS